MSNHGSMNRESGLHRDFINRIEELLSQGREEEVSELLDAAMAAQSKLAQTEQHDIGCRLTQPWETKALGLLKQLESDSVCASVLGIVANFFEFLRRGRRPIALS